MFGINKVYLVGFLGSDPQACKSKAGKDYTKLSVATHRSRKTEDGWDTITDWHNVTVWGKQGESCVQNLRKGSKVMVEGYLSHYEVIDAEGDSKKMTGITAHNIEFFNAQQTSAAA